MIKVSSIVLFGSRVPISKENEGKREMEGEKDETF